MRNWITGGGIVTAIIGAIPLVLSNFVPMETTGTWWAQVLGLLFGGTTLAVGAQATRLVPTGGTAQMLEDLRKQLEADLKKSLPQEAAPNPAPEPIMMPKTVNPAIVRAPAPAETKCEPGKDCLFPIACDHQNDFDAVHHLTVRMAQAGDTEGVAACKVLFDRLFAQRYTPQPPKANPDVPVA